MVPRTGGDVAYRESAADSVATGRAPVGAARDQAGAAPPRVDLRKSASRWERSHHALLLIADGLALVAAAALGILLGPPGAASGYLLMVIPVWIAGLAIMGAYDLRHTGSGSRELSRVVGASLRVALLISALAYLLPTDLARGVVFVTLPAGAALLVAGRTAAQRVVAAAHRRGHGQHRVIVVGRVAEVLDLVEQAGRTPDAGFQVVGACIPQYDGPGRRIRDNRRGSSGGPTHGQREGDRRAEPDRRADAEHLIAVGVPIAGRPHEVLDAVNACQADTVVVAGQGILSRHALRRLTWQLEGTGVEIYFASSLSDVATPRITLRPLGALPLMHVEAPMFDGGQRLLKAVTDRLLAIVLVVIMSPVIAVVSILIKVDSSGPVFYRQERIGLGGRRFRCLKFRTMRTGAHEERTTLRSESTGVLFKIRDDPRVTRVGRLLRRSSLDELPQLFNVLAGSMSLVGPRPPLASEAAEFGSDVQRRLLVKPGMTGLWQVSGRSDLSWAESVRLDLYYVENWSLYLDLQLMARTVVAVIAGRGAY